MIKIPKNKEAKLIEKVTNINSKIFKMSSSETNDFGSGGMFTKIQAAEIASTFGCKTIIMRGNTNSPISTFEKQKKGTIFTNVARKKDSFKNWLGGSINISGSVYIDDGAIKALNDGASLLPSGIKKYQVIFQKVI